MGTNINIAEAEIFGTVWYVKGMTGSKYSKYSKYSGEYFKIAGEIGNTGAMRTNQSCAGVSSRMREGWQL